MRAIELIHAFYTRVELKNLIVLSGRFFEYAVSGLETVFRISTEIDFGIV